MQALGSRRRSVKTGASPIISRQDIRLDSFYLDAVGSNGA